MCQYFFSLSSFRNCKLRLFFVRITSTSYRPASSYSRSPFSELRPRRVLTHLRMATWRVWFRIGRSCPGSALNFGQTLLYDTSDLANPKMVVPGRTEQCVVSCVCKLSTHGVDISDKWWLVMIVSGDYTAIIPVVPHKAVAEVSKRWSL